MAFITLNYFSEALGTQTEVYVVIPQKSNVGEIGIGTARHTGQYKCLYLLHGYGDDQTIWMRRTSIERYATEYGICVVMPCGGRSFYTDMKYAMKYYTFVAKELPKVVCEMFPVSDRREDNYLAGNSMGGYGALKIALRECDRFCGAAALSPVTDLNFLQRQGWFDLFHMIFGDTDDIPEQEQLSWLLEQKKEDPNRPRIYVGVGREDFLYGDSRTFREQIEAMDYDFTYRESAGKHSWAFWDEYIRYALKWMFG